jgi:hypothetical protein
MQSAKLNPSKKRLFGSDSSDDFASAITQNILKPAVKRMMKNDPPELRKTQ